MAHRIDAQKITDRTAAQTAINAALVRLTAIENGSTMTTTQVRTAVREMAGYLKHIIRLVT